MQKYRVTIAHIVPPIVIALAKQPIVDKFDLSSIKMVMSGAAPLGAEIQQELAKRLGVIVKQGYGMTELSPVSHVNANNHVVPGTRAVRPGGFRGSVGVADSWSCPAPAAAASGAGSIGRLLANQTAKIVDPASGKLLGYDQEGELWIKGPNVMKGYLNNPKATHETIDSEGYLHTGDIARVDRNNTFYITDRIKELIKYKGLQVAPGTTPERDDARAPAALWRLTEPRVRDGGPGPPAQPSWRRCC